MEPVRVREILDKTRFIVYMHKYVPNWTYLSIISRKSNEYNLIAEQLSGIELNDVITDYAKLADGLIYSKRDNSFVCLNQTCDFSFELQRRHQLVPVHQNYIILESYFPQEHLQELEKQGAIGHFIEIPMNKI